MEQDRAWVNQTSTADGSLSVPHFDEEATLLRARPVVPLHEVKTESSRRRRLVLGLTLVAVLMLGAVTATLVYSNRQQPDEAPATARDNSVSTSGDAGGSVINSSQPAPSAPSAVTEDRPFERQIDKVGNSSLTRKQAARDAGSATVPTRAREVEQDRAEDLAQDEARTRRAERREARRQRREAEREARRKAQSSDGLLRIREIFEGAPRP
ncbi:MAG: hypothetical protein ACREBG_09250 [Pyrinomonadaceae bacterium]